MNNAAKAALERFRAARTQRDRDQAYSDYGCALRGEPRVHAFDAMPGRGSRSPKYGRDEDDDLELKLRRLFDQVKSLLDNTELLPDEKAALLADCGLSATLGTDEPLAFSGRPSTGGRLDPTDIDRDLTTREAARPQKEKDYDRMGQDGSRSLDRMFPAAARIGSAAELHKSRPRASYETKSSLDVFLGRAGARIRNLG